MSEIDELRERVQTLENRLENHVHNYNLVFSWGLENYPTTQPIFLVDVNGIPLKKWIKGIK